VITMAKPMLRSMMMDMLSLGDGKSDCTYSQVQEAESKTWKAKGDESWASFQKARPYSCPGYESHAPKVGDAVPDGPIASLDKGAAASTLLAEATKLGKRVAISFDSLSCPVWRTFGGAEFHNAATAAGLPVLHIYTREAHGKDDFDAGPNDSGPMALEHAINMAKTEEERRGTAMKAKTLISEQVSMSEGVTMWCDAMDDWAEAAFEARPFRMYVIDTEEQKIVYVAGLTPFNMGAKANDIKALKSQ